MTRPESTPLISVIVTCYNYANYVSEAIDSVLDQSYKSIELIVINDGSTDNSGEVIKRLQKKQTFKYISGENKGVVYARNKGIEAASGEFVVFLDADDILDGDYVAKTADAAIKTGADVIYTDVQTFGAAENRVVFPEFNLEAMKIQNQIHISSLVRKSAIGTKPFDPKLNKLSHEDWDFFLKLALNGAKFVKQPDTVLRYRIHADGISRNSDRTKNGIKYSKAYSYIYNKYAALYPDFIADHVEYIKGLIAEGSRQSDENEALNGEIGNLRKDNLRLRNEKKSLNDSIILLRNSASWRITAPLRRISSLKRYLRGQ